MNSAGSELKDKVTVGLTPAGLRRLEAVMASDWFAEEMVAYRVAISVAIARGLVAEPSEMAGVQTKFNVGSLDRDGKLRSLITALVPEAAPRPYENAERRAEAGLKFMAERLEQGAHLADVLGVSVESESMEDLEEV